MAFSVLRNTAFVAASMMILFGTTSPVAGANLPKRDGAVSTTVAGCNPDTSIQLNAHECNIAMYNLPYSQERTKLVINGPYVENSYGGCRIIVTCQGQRVGSNQLLSNSGKGGGYLLLQQTCINNGLAGQIMIDEGCTIQAVKA